MLKNIIFKARIDYSYNYRMKGLFLRRKSLNEDNINFEKVEQVAKNVILSELPKDMNEIFNIPINTRYIATREGSLLIFFEVLFTGYNILSKYKGFYDSINLIKNQCERLLDGSLGNIYNDRLESSVNIEYPNLPEPRYNIIRRFFERRKGIDNDEVFELLSSKATIKRDGFFYYLLISNIFLIGIIFYLVFSAICKTYFP